jgi:tetratricopeptide (TPR) repeat protein
LQVRAREQLEQACSLFERAAQPDPIQVGGTLWELGMVLYALGEPLAARQKLEQGLGLLRTSQTPPAMVLSAQTLIALTWVLRTLGDFEGALSAATRCHGFVSQSVGVTHPVVAMSLALMARAEWGLNRMDAAREHIAAALDVLSKVGQALPLIAGTWYTIAQVQADLGELDAAFESATKGRAIGERAYGRDHQLVAHNVYLLGCLRLRRGEHDEARLLLERALESGERAGLYLHEDVALSRVELAKLTRELEGPENARTQLLQALAAISRVCQDNARFEGTCRVTLAAVSRELGDLEESERECWAGLTVLEARYGAQHPLRIPGLVLLAWLRWDQGDVERAAAFFGEAQSIGDASGIVLHPDYAESVEGLGVVDSARGNDPAARRSFTRALGIFQATLGPEHSAAARLSRRLRGLG